MTIPSSVNRNDYTGNGATSVFVYGFKIWNQGHLLIFETDLSNVTTQKSVPGDYTVQDVGKAIGTVTRTAGALPTGHRIAIIRQLPYEQSTDLRNAGGYFPEDIEDTLDKIFTLILSLKSQVDLSLKAPLAVNPSSFPASTAALVNYANDAAAAAGGVPVNGLYRNGSVIQVRVV